MNNSDYIKGDGSKVIVKSLLPKVWWEYESSGKKKKIACKVTDVGFGAFEPGEPEMEWVCVMVKKEKYKDLKPTTIYMKNAMGTVEGDPPLGRRLRLERMTPPITKYWICKCASLNISIDQAVLSAASKRRIMKSTIFGVATSGIFVNAAGGQLALYVCALMSMHFAFISLTKRVHCSAE